MTTRTGTCIAAAIVAALSAVAAITLTARKSDAREGGGVGHFSNKTIAGQWGFGSTVGEFLPPATPQPTPAAAIGRIFFDGDGNCQVESITNVGGTTVHLTSSSCTYTVDPSGFGSSEATFPGAPIPGPVPVSFVIVDEAREIRFVNTSSIIGTFTAKRQ
jgi:hypothetical protein